MNNITSVSLLVAAALALVPARSLIAGEKHIVNDTLATVQVTGSGTVSSRSSSVVFAPDQFLGRHSDLGALLRTVPGLTIRSSGGIGNYSEVSVRGSSAKQVQVFLDGVPLNSALDGAAVNIGLVSLSGLESVSVYKGVAPLALSGYNAAGVVDLQSTPHSAGVTGFLDAGSFETILGFARASGSGTRGGGHVGVQALRTAGNYPFLFDNNTTLGPEHTADDQVLHMDNNQTGSARINAGGYVRVGTGGRIGVAVDAAHSDQGIFYYPDAGNNNGYTRRTDASVREFVRVPLAPQTQLQIDLAQYFERALFERRGAYYYGALHIRSLSQSAGGSAQALLRGSVIDNLDYELLTEIRADGFVRDNLLFDNDPGELPAAARVSLRAGGELNWTAVDQLTLTGQYIHRIEIDTVNTHFADSVLDLTQAHRTLSQHPTASLSARLSPNSSMVFFTSCSYASMSPSLRDRFSFSPGFLGNDTLAPEKRFGAEAGLEAGVGSVQLTLSGFVATSRDKICYIGSRLDKVSPMNIARVDGGGGELSIDAAAGKWVQMSSRTTLMKNIIRSRAFGWYGNWEPLLPVLSQHLRLSLTPQTWLSVEQALTYRSRYFLNPDNTITGPPLSQKNAPYLDALIRIRPLDWVEIVGRVDNYLDIRNYDFRDSPRPGRSYSLNLRIAHSLSTHKKSGPDARKTWQKEIEK